MCNFVHQNNDKKMRFRKNGTGWKLFGLSVQPSWAALTTLLFGDFYTMGKDGWISWNKKAEAGDGFCFFYTPKEAFLALKDWKRFCRLVGRDWNSPTYKQVVRKIQYKNSLVKQKENNFTSNAVEIGICKQFKVL